MDDFYFVQIDNNQFKYVSNKCSLPQKSFSYGVIMEKIFLGLTLFLLLLNSAICASEKASKKFFHIQGKIPSGFSLKAYVTYQGTRNTLVCLNDIIRPSIRTKEVLINSKIKNGKYSLKIDFDKYKHLLCRYEAFFIQLMVIAPKLDDRIRLDKDNFELAINLNVLNPTYPDLSEVKNLSCGQSIFYVNKRIYDSIRFTCMHENTQRKNFYLNQSYYNDSFDISFTPRIINTTDTTALEEIIMPNGSHLQIFSNEQNEIGANSPIILDSNYHPDGLLAGKYVADNRAFEWFGGENIYNVLSIDARESNEKIETQILRNLSDRDRNIFNNSVGCDIEENDDYKTVIYRFKQDDIGNKIKVHSYCF